ncbi:hypothetical protein [Acaricomes phytoseiuli]
MTTVVTEIEGQSHPLNPLSAEEIAAVRDHLTAAGRLTETVRVTYLSLKEPAKNEMRRLREGGAAPARQARAVLLDITTGETWDVLVDLSHRVTVAETLVDPELVGQAPILLEEFDVLEEVLAADPDWAEALATRGLTPGQVRIAPL